MSIVPFPGVCAAERRLRADVPVFINSFEQLTYLRSTVNWFHTNGFSKITVVEQGSRFAPLRDYLTSDEFKAKACVRWLGANMGPRRAVRQVVHWIGQGQPFIFTDPDLDLPDPVAPDFMTRLFALGQRYAVAKVGLALDLSDAKKIDLQRQFGPKHTIASYYRRFFRALVEPEVYAATVDTTFFLHVPQPHLSNFGILSSQPRVPAVRVAGAGFLAGHRPWYFDNGLTPDEEAHYRARTSGVSTHFGRAP